MDSVPYGYTKSAVARACMRVQVFTVMHGHDTDTQSSCGTTASICKTLSDIVRLSPFDWELHPSEPSIYMGSKVDDRKFGRPKLYPYLSCITAGGERTKVFSPS